MMNRRHLGLFLALCVFTVLNLTPIIWAFLISIKQPVDAFSIPPTLIFTPTWEFHYEVWVTKEFWRFLINSLIISISVVGISVPIGTLAAYALSRLQTPRMRLILFGLLATRMLPPILLAIPFFLMATFLRLVDTYIVMVLALIALNQPFTIWLMRSFFVDVPVELDESARLDGCNHWQVFFLIVLPLVRPGLTVTMMFSLLLAYNEFLLALILTGSKTKPLPVAIAEYGGEDITYWSLSAAGAMGIMIPVVLFAIFSHRHLVRGLTFGAIKE